MVAGSVGRYGPEGRPDFDILTGGVGGAAAGPEFDGFDRSPAAGGRVLTGGAALPMLPMWAAAGCPIGMWAASQPEGGWVVRARERRT